MNEEYSISTILATIINGLTKNIGLLREYDADLRIEEFAHAFNVITNNPYGNLSEPYINDFGRMSENFVPYGTVGVSIDKMISPTQFAEILSVLIQTRNSIVIQPSFSPALSKNP